MSKTRVRRALPADLDAVVALRVALLREYPDHPVYGRLHPQVTARARELFVGQLRNEAEAIFLAEHDGQVAGIIRCVEMIGSPLLEPSRYAYVSSAYVKPEFRRRGVLRALLDAADRWATNLGLNEMRLHNVVDSAAAEGAWASLGFEVVEQVRLRTLPAR